MAMQFDRFVRELDAAVRALGAGARLDESRAGSATWSARERQADLALLEPLNVSLALARPGAPPVTTWYPIHENLVPVVSRRIAAYLSEA
jgi:hypothetical protein